MTASSDSLRLLAPALPRERTAAVPSALGEAELVACAQAGDRTALQEIYRRYADTVFRRLTHLLGPDPEREDLLQLVFAELFRGLQRFRGQAQFSTYLYRMVTNIAYDHLSRRSRRGWRRSADTLENLPVSEPSPEAVAMRRQMVSEVLRCLDRIKPKKRIAFLLRVSEGLSVEEIAAQVGASPEAVAKRIQHAQRELLALVEKKNRRYP